jgi:hypothetical protein
MSKTRDRRPASPARRSLVELTAAASRAIDNGLVVSSANLIAADDPPRSASKTHDRTLVIGRVTAPTAAAVPESLNEVTTRDGELAHSDSSAEMLVKIAKDCHTKAFDGIELATKVGSEAALKGYGGSIFEDNFLSFLTGSAIEFRAEALELMKANVTTSFEYARTLAGTTAQFVELSGTQARKQCELILKQAGSLTSLCASDNDVSAD